MCSSDLCTITATQSGNNVYAAATPVTQSFTITLVPRTPQNPELIPPSAMTTTDAPQRLWTNSNTTTPITISVGPASVCTLDSSNRVVPVAAGTCTITVSQPETRQYLAGNSSTQMTIIRPTATNARLLVALTWSTPASIYQGTPLSSIQLNARASVPGTYI